MVKKILIVVATHGDEKIGTEVAIILKKRGYGKYFDCLIANPKALKQNKRFVDFDLNRAYPGAKRSVLYEKEIAYKNLQKAKKYPYTIDIHEASAGKDDFIIIPRDKISSDFPLKFIDLRRVLLWPVPKGPLSQFLKSAVELEFGMKGRCRRRVVLKAARVIERFIKKVLSEKSSNISEKEFFYVYSRLLLSEAKRKNCNFGKLRDFKMAKVAGGRFYPLLVGQYLKEGIICYKMKKINKDSIPQFLGDADGD